MTSSGTLRVAAAVLLLAWLVAGLFLTLAPAYPLPGQVVTDNLLPFRTIGIYLSHLSDPFWIRQLVGNVALLLPIGFLGPFVTPALDRWWRVGLLALALSTMIEAAQRGIPNRAADVDDVLVNVLGALLGFALWRLLSLLLARRA